MKITFELDDVTVQSYLDHFNEVEGTEFTVDNLTPEDAEKLARLFSELANDEIKMRCDDHSGFQTDEYLLDVFFPVDPIL